MNTYFTILSREQVADSYHYQVVINPACKVFEGHFPGEPIAPGVCNMQMLLDCVADAYGPLRLCSISRCKFAQRVIPDGQTLQVTLRLEGDKLNADLQQQATICMQATMLIARE